MCKADEADNLKIFFLLSAWHLENDRPIDCCISHKCGGQGQPGTCVNSDRPTAVNRGLYYLS